MTIIVSLGIISVKTLVRGISVLVRGVGRLEGICVWWRETRCLGAWIVVADVIILGMIKMGLFVRVG